MLSRALINGRSLNFHTPRCHELKNFLCTTDLKCPIFSAFLKTSYASTFSPIIVSNPLHFMWSSCMPHSLLFGYIQQSNFILKMFCETSCLDVCEVLCAKKQFLYGQRYASELTWTIYKNYGYEQKLVVVPVLQ